MAEQEFLVSFGVDIDETGLDKMQQALEDNKSLAESLAAAFDTARGAISSFFDQLSASTLDTGETSPYQRLQEMSDEGISIDFEVDFTQANDDLDAFLLKAADPILLTGDAADLTTAGTDAFDAIAALFESPFLLTGDATDLTAAGSDAQADLLDLFGNTLFPLYGDASDLTTAGTDALDTITSLFADAIFPLTGDSAGILSAGSDALTQLETDYAATLLALKADASAVLTAGTEALNQLKATFDATTLTIRANVVTNNPTGNNTGGNNTGGTGGAGSNPATTPVGRSPVSVMLAAGGGRFDRPTQTQVAEDGDPEYVIPVRKESLAVPLLRQLFGELSDSARETLKQDLGAAAARDSLADLPGLLAAAPSATAPILTDNSTHSVQAPVSIQVTAPPGTSPEDVGRSIYDVTERYLLRTIQATI